MLFCKKSEKRYKMKYIVPNYYKKFKCIADKCKHSCCVGWKIDIDNDTYEKYQTITGDFGNKLNKNIQVNDNIAYFKLDNKDRCPFLNQNNLCDIILNIGEDYLCQICNDHPRFRNFYGGVTEIGLGLCCEAVAELIVKQTEKFSLEIIDSDNSDDYNSVDENNFFEFRSQIFDILQDRNITINQRINNVLNYCNINYVKENIIDTTKFLLSLERLDNKWTNILNDLKKYDFSEAALPSYFEIVAEQLLVYFTYRHLSGCLEDGRLLERILFIIFNYKVIEKLCRYHINKYHKLTYSDIAEYARLYSSEIEYSEENIESILEKFA